jgi:SAM-dependent methyltransferase
LALPTTCDPIIDRLLELPIESVLILGVHTGKEAQRFIEAGKQVTGVDLLPPYRKGYEHIRGRFEDVELGQYDAALSSHMLEHVTDVGAVLRKLRQVVKPDGWLGLVVPGYPQDEFFVGHLTLWTPALLLYNLVFAGWNCRDAKYYTSEGRHHVGVLVQNRPVSLEGLGWDAQMDVQKYMPVPFVHKMSAWLPDRFN